MSDRFWQSAEKAEADYIGDGDLPQFQRRMKQLGFDDEMIADRVASVQELKDACAKNIGTQP